MEQQLGILRKTRRPKESLDHRHAHSPQGPASRRRKPLTRWRINFYRIDRAPQAFLAWNPTLTRTYHTPERFGWIQFE